jgi:hypothetical protein
MNLIATGASCLSANKWEQKYPVTEIRSLWHHPNNLSLNAEHELIIYDTSIIVNHMEQTIALSEDQH